MTAANLAKFIWVLAISGLFGCSEAASSDSFTFGETTSDTGQSIRFETRDDDLLEIASESQSTVFRLRSGDIEIGIANITCRGKEVFVLPQTWSSVKLVKADGRVRIDIDREQVATIDTRI